MTSTPRNAFVEFVLDQLRDLGEAEDLEARPMFGAHGLYHGERFFGIVSGGQLFLKTDARTRAPYDRRGMRPFQPSAKQIIRNYHAVPAEILEQRTELAAWARSAIALTQPPPQETGAPATRATPATPKPKRKGRQRP